MLISIFKLIMLAGMLLISATSQAGSKTLFLLTPLNATTFNVPENSSVAVEYLLTNQSSLTRTLKWLPIQGVVQYLSGGPIQGYALCQTTTTLAPNESCVLVLNVIGGIMPEVIHAYPKVCKIKYGTQDETDLTVCSIACTPFQATKIQAASWLYVSDASSVQTCSLDGLGALTSCLAQTTPADAPFQLVLTTLGTLSAYLADQSVISGPAVDYCQVSAVDGSLSSCQQAIALDSNARTSGLALNAPQTYLYVTTANVTAGQVQRCTLQLDQSISSCTPAETNPTPFTRANGIVLNPQGTYAYVTDITPSLIYRCTINATGQWTSCINAGGGTFNQPNTLALSPDGHTLYVTDAGTQQVLSCPVLTTGLLGSCTSVLNGVEGVYGIALNNPQNRVYLTQDLGANPDKIDFCQISTGGLLSSCVPYSSYVTTPNYITLGFTR